MKTLWLARKLSKTNLTEATHRYLEELSNAPVRQSRDSTTRLLRELASQPSPKVYLGTTPWSEPVHVPLLEMAKAMGLATGGTGAGKTMAALFPLQAIIKRLPRLRTIGFGVLDAKGELFERVLYLLAARLSELAPPEREELARRIVIIDFAGRESISSYNILARWQYTEPDFFLTSRLETLRELLPAGEKLSLRGASVLKQVLALLSEFGLPLTYLDRVLTDQDFRGRLLAATRDEELKQYFSRHFAVEGKQTIAALRARMDSLFASEGVRLALAGSTAPDFLQLQNEGKIVLVNCAGSTITRGVRLLLQGLVLSDIRQAIFARPNNPPVTYVWVADEAQNFFLTRQQQENMTDVLTMARSFGTFFHFLCQNLSTAVPDARVLETLYTNIRWSLTLRSTPRDAAFLKSALPITGRTRRADANPFRESAVLNPEEERMLALNGIATLPDQEGYLWLKTRSETAIRVRIPRINLGPHAEFRAIIDHLLQRTTLGGRFRRAQYEAFIRERDQRWRGVPVNGEESHLAERMAARYREIREVHA